jgi:hypothetical protein
MTKERCNPQRVGISVECTVCHRPKNPLGRSAPLAMANGLCDWECPGHELEPFVGTLWPGETCDDFGYAHSHSATRVLTREETPRDR